MTRVVLLLLMCAVVGCQPPEPQKGVKSDNAASSRSKGAEDQRPSDPPGPPPVPLAIRLKSQDPKERLQAAQASVEGIQHSFLPKERADRLDTLIAMHLDLNAKNTADQILKKLNDPLDGFANLSALVEATGDEDERVRAEAVAAVAMLGPRVKSAIPQLLKRLSEDTGDSRCSAAEVLWWVDRNAAVAGALEEELRSDNAKRRQRALAALERMSGQPRADDSSPLSKVQRDLQFDFREKDSSRAFIDQVGLTNEKAKEAIYSASKHFLVTTTEFERLFAGKNESLLKALSELEGDALDRNRAADVLSRAPGAVLDALTQIAKKKELASKSVPVLMVAATGIIQRSSDPAIRQKAMETIRQFGSAGSVAIPALTAALADRNPKVRKSAAETLGAFGSEAKEAVPALVKALQDADLDARYAAGQALKAIDPEAAKKALVP